MHRTEQRCGDAEQLGRAAADWLAAGNGVLADDLSLYSGAAGALMGLHEAHRHFSDDAYGAAVVRLADALSARIESTDDCSLYFGLVGTAVALSSVGHVDAARRALSRVRDQCDVRGRWGEMFELLLGNAGVGLGALCAGDLELAVSAVTPYLTSADATADGVQWSVRPSPSRSHHMAHGTLGIVYALTAVGQAADRDDMVELALAGAADVVSRNVAGSEGFLVPHSDPQHRPDIVDRYSYGWCNGPAGDAQVFRLLAQVTGDSIWVEYQNRCWTTLVRSGLPRRSRPGFWDNSGRCCGTAGVLALACDRIVERDDDPALADLLVDDLLARATADSSGARWSNTEHTASPSELEPLGGWAMGNAGIIRELLRCVRIAHDGDPGYAAQWPDHPAGKSSTTRRARGG